MLPGAVALAAFGFLGAFGSGVANIQPAHALAGDICDYSTDATAAQPGAFYNNNSGPVDYVVSPGETYGLVFRVEDAGVAGYEPPVRQPQDAQLRYDNFGIQPVVSVRIDSETGSARITGEAEVQGNLFPNSLGWIWPNVWHNPRNIEGDTTVDTIDPNQFNDPDGNPMSSSATSRRAVSPTGSTMLRTSDAAGFVYVASLVFQRLRQLDR